jgi:hypothetical protein
MVEPALACVSFLVGVVIDESISAGPNAVAAEDAVRTVLSEFHAKVSELAIIVVSPDARRSAALTIPHRIAPAAVVAAMSDVLVLVSGPVPSAELRALADRRRFGARPKGGGEANLLSPLDNGAFRQIEIADDGRITSHSVFPERYSGDTRCEHDFWTSLKRRERYAKDLAALGAPFTDCTTLHVGTDAIANRLQTISRVGRTLLYVFCFLALTAHSAGNGRVQLLLQYGFLALALATFLLLRAREYQSRHQDYRAISEALRVRTVWTFVHLQTRLDDGYLPMQQTELAWIRDVLRVASFIGYSDTGKHANDDQDLAVVSAWIDDQREYYRKRSRGEALRRDRFSLTVAILGYVGLAAGATAFVVAANGVQFAIDTPTGSIDLRALAGGVAIWATGAALLVREFSHSHAFAENANRYEQMFFVFDRAREVLKADPQQQMALEVAAALGRAALTEHGDWLLLQRERPIALPPGGP